MFRRRSILLLLFLLVIFIVVELWSWSRARHIGKCADKAGDVGVMVVFCEVIEPLSQPLFWVLAIFLIEFWLMTVQAAPNTTAINNPSKTWNVVYLKWLEPHLNSPLRKFGALTIYLGIVGLQLLEGWWIPQLDLTVFRGLWRQFAERSMSPILMCAGMSIWSVFIAMNLCARVLILIVRLTCIGDIVSMPVRSREPEKKEA